MQMKKLVFKNIRILIFFEPNLVSKPLIAQVTKTLPTKGNFVINNFKEKYAGI